MNRKVASEDHIFSTSNLVMHNLPKGRAQVHLLTAFLGLETQLNFFLRSIQVVLPSHIYSGLGKIWAFFFVETSNKFKLRPLFLALKIIMLILEDINRVPDL